MITSKLSLLQMQSSVDIEKNIKQLTLALQRLQPSPEQLILLPENALLFAHREAYLELAEPLGCGPYQQQLASLAKQYQCYLICGSFPIKSAQAGKIHTTSLVYGMTGELIAYYHKIHLFDALVDDDKGSYKESDTFLAGKQLKLFEWLVGGATFKVGLTICYDLRFPGLFQQLRQQGADIILVPAAFTKVTGEAHWLALLKARAIENQCYIVAANQGGEHDSGRQTYGHSVIISPWGEILGELGMGQDTLCAVFDKQRLDEVRKAMPVFTHNQFLNCTFDV